MFEIDKRSSCGSKRFWCLACDPSTRCGDAVSVFFYHSGTLFPWRHGQLLQSPATQSTTILRNACCISSRNSIVTKKHVFNFELCAMSCHRSKNSGNCETIVCTVYRPIGYLDCMPDCLTVYARSAIYFTHLYFVARKLSYHLIHVLHSVTK